MDEVAPLVGDVLMEQAVLLDGLLIIPGTGFHPAQPLLDSGQFFLGILQPMGRVRHAAVVGHIEVRQGILQPDRPLRRRRDGYCLPGWTGIEDGAVIFPRAGLADSDPPELPPRLRPAVERGPDDAGLGHTDAVPGGVDGRAGCKVVVAGGKGIPVVFFSFEFGVPEALRILKEHAERLGELVVLLRQRLIIDFPQKRGAVFVLGRGRDEVLIGFQIESLLVGQHLVPNVPAAAEGLFEQLPLGLVGVEPDFDGDVTDSAVVVRQFFRRPHTVHPVSSSPDLLQKV